jgi:hypothetical protein
MTTMMFNRTHLCADGDTEVHMRVADGKVYLEFGSDEQHMLTISATPEHIVTLLLKAAARVIEHTEEVSA